MAPKLPATEKAARDRQIVADRLKPLSWAAIGAKHNLDPSTCKRVFYEWRRSVKPGTDLQGKDPIEIVWESVERYENWIEQLTEIAFGPETQESVRVGAINAQMTAQQKLTELLQATGILPKQLGKLRIEADVRYVAQAILQVFEEEGVDARVRERVVGVIRGASSRN